MILDEIIIGHYYHYKPPEKPDNYVVLCLHKNETKVQAKLVMRNQERIDHAQIIVIWIMPETIIKELK